MNIKSNIQLAILIGGMFSHSLSIQAQPRKPQVGAINIEEAPDKTVNYASVQKDTIQYFTTLAERIKTLGSDQNANTQNELPKISDNSLLYLNGVYLFCSINGGACPLPLEAMYEVDVINSIATKSMGCPTLTRFWKFWIKNDMESRHKYGIQMAYMGTTSEFNQNQRPRFLKCEDTLKAEILPHKDENGFLSARYRQVSVARTSVLSMLQLLKELEQKVPNVFSATKSPNPFVAAE